MSGLCGRLRDLHVRPYLDKILPHLHMVIAETYRIHVLSVLIT